MITKNAYNLLKISLFRYFNLLLVFILASSFVGLQAQDPDEEGEVFWEDNEEYDSDDIQFEDDEEFLDDDYYDDEEEDLEEDYEDAFIDDDETFNEDEENELIEIDSDESLDRSGWSVDISGASARLVNYTLWKEYGLDETVWEPSINGKISIEAPYMFQLIGLRFRLGAELGTFGFVDLTPREAELKGISAAILASIPAGPGKIKLGTGIFGKSMGFMFEATYGIAIGSVDLRLGLRSTEIMGAIDDKDKSFGHLGWMDGVMALGVNF